MNKTQLIDVIAEKADLSKTQASSSGIYSGGDYRVSERR